MTYKLRPFADIGLNESLLRLLIDEHRDSVLPALNHLWAYYRNPSKSAPCAAGARSASSCKRLAQAAGLPDRLRGLRDALDDDRAAAREIVIENDIAWRLHAMVDFMLSSPVSFLSTAQDETTRNMVQRLLDAVFEASGGVGLLQDMVLLASIYGHIDLLLRTDDLFTTIRQASIAQGAHEAVAIARRLRVELIEAPRSLPILNPRDFRRLDAMLICFTQQLNVVDAQPGFKAAGILRSRNGAGAQRRSTAELVEIHSATHRQLYQNEQLIDESINPIGELPIVHIQNSSQPFHFEGLSEVEPLIPLQDELNTRISDRANRVTMQSFKMYLAKGIDAIEAGAPIRIAPGQVWTTDNPDAQINAFGGDAQSPSEDNHIEQIRQAMDKTSAVTPLAAGVIRAKIGQLSSENALRISLMGLVSKTQRKQQIFGRGLAELSRLILVALDLAGVYHTEPEDRGVRIEWPNPLPVRERDRLEAALIKQRLGVPRDRVLAELGYAPTDQGVA